MMIVFANTKGGVGKSTLAVHLAIWLHDRGETVALLDADSQQSSSQWLKEVEPKITVSTALTPADIAREAQSLSRPASFLVADGPGGLHDASRTLLLLADLALFPISPSILDLRSVSQATTVLKEAHTINNEKPEGRLILNRMRRRDTISRELQVAAPSLGLTVAKTQVHDLQVYRDAAQQGSVVTRMGFRGRKAAQEMSQLFTELLTDKLAFIDTSDTTKKQRGTKCQTVAR